MLYIYIYIYIYRVVQKASRWLVFAVALLAEIGYIVRAMSAQKITPIPYTYCR